jgi:hypothetical protein
LAVVSSGGRYKAAVEFIPAKLGHKIDAASGLEGAKDLVILVLHPEFRAGPDETS